MDDRARRKAWIAATAFTLLVAAVGATTWLFTRKPSPPAFAPTASFASDPIVDRRGPARADAPRPPRGQQEVAARALADADGSATTDLAPVAASPGYEPWADAPALRAVEGLVRDARTHAPIAGAWLTWQLPPPDICEQLFAQGDLRRDPAFTMVTDGEGRFRLQRLPDDAPRSSTVYAVAPGYAFAAMRVGLEREVVIDLAAMGTLDVQVDGPSRERAPVLRLEPGDANAADPRALARDRILAALPPWGADPRATRYRIPHLEPGAYRVLLDGAFAADVHVPEGATAFLRLERAPLEPMGGVVHVPEGVASHAEVTFVRADGAGHHTLMTDATGRFAGALPPGRYTAMLVDGLSERALPGTWGPGEPDLSMRLTERGEPVQIAVHIDGHPLRALDVGLVRRGSTTPDLIYLAPDRGPGVFAGQAPVGAYALFSGSILLAEVEVPRDAVQPLDLQTHSLAVAWRVPDALMQDEVIRGHVALVPAFVQASPALRARFADAAAAPFLARRGGAAQTFIVVHPGDYVIVGESDLGPIEVPIAVLGSASVEVPLLAP